MVTVYHGSQAKFKMFDYTKMGKNATSEGYGFYFTDIKQIAEAYAQNGYLYTVELNANKPLSSTKKTITCSQLKKFLTKLHELSNNYYLTDYGDIDFIGFEKVLAYAVDNIYSSANDVDIIADICNVYGNKEPLQVLYNMFGYDHIKTVAEWNHGLDKEQTLYIALVNDIITIKEITKQ